MEHISKAFSGVPALRNVDFRVKKGEVAALIGENGAGKSTLMKVLSGVYKYGEYSGDIFINGAKAKFSSPSDAENAGVSMIYQELSPFLDLSIAENIYMGNYPTNLGRTVDWTKLYDMSKKLLETLGLDYDVKMALRRLGASQQQLVAIARALARDSAILVFDEPTSSLTSSETRNLFGIIKNLRDRGKSVVYISHKLDEIFAVADRIDVLRDGENSGEFEIGKCEAKDIIKSMIGRDISQMYPVNNAKKGAVVMEVKNLNVRHPYVPDKKLIDDVGFSVREGEILGLVGLVGSGRTEILNSIFGSHKGNYSREQILEGKKTEIKNPYEARNARMALITENRRFNGIVGIMGIDTNITLPYLKSVQTSLIIDKKKETGIAAKYVEELRIKCSSVKMRLEYLSGGNQQKVVLSKWLNTSPRVLLMDEPTRGIDVGSKVEIYEIMNKLAESGIAIVWASSEMPEILAVSDRVLVLYDGTIRGQFSRGEADQEKILALASGVD
jgi:D-xylose transport system ATP-binding protein